MVKHVGAIYKNVYYKNVLLFWLTICILYCFSIIIKLFVFKFTITILKICQSFSYLLLLKESCVKAQSKFVSIALLK